MLALALLAAGMAQSSDDLVREVVVGHRETMDKIRTFAATVSFNDPAEPRMGTTGRYFREAERAILRVEKQGYGTGRFLLEPGRLRMLSVATAKPDGQRLPRPEVSAGVRPVTYGLLLNVWPDFGLAFETRSNRYVHLGVAVTEPGANPSARRETVDGRTLIRLRYTYHLTPEFAMHATQWHDPARGYLVVRRDVATDDGSPQGGRADFTDFVSAGGVEFPTKVTRSSEHEGSTIQTTTLTDIEINRPLPHDTFDMTLPAGTQVTDDVRKTEYLAGSDWKPTGPEKPWSSVAFTPPVAVTGAPTRQSSDHESRGWPAWLVVGSAVLLVFGGTTLLFRRSRTTG